MASVAPPDDDFPNNVACCLANRQDSPVIQKEVISVTSSEFAIPLKDSVDVGISAPSIPVLPEKPAVVKNGTALFSAIENEKWENTILFLETGSFFGWEENAMSMFGWGNNEPKQDPEAQVRTWVVGNDWWGNVISKRLPIHAAISKKAPISLIQKLIEMYPESIRCGDMEGNLPLHLSFKENSPDGVVAFLLKSYPEAVSEKNKAGHQPVDYASADACEIIQLCVEQTNKVAKREEERLCQALESEKTRLTEILTQLSEIRGELDHLRKTKTKETREPENHGEHDHLWKTKMKETKEHENRSELDHLQKTKMKETKEPPIIAEPVENEAVSKTQEGERPRVVATKKQKSDRKVHVRLPWMKKRVSAA